MPESELRQRKTPAEAPSPTKGNSRKTKKVDDEDAYSPWVDVLRVLTFLFLVSCGLSYVISGGESWFWGMKDKPNYLKVGYWKAMITGPLHLTPDELSAYDGTDPSKPIYLAINGTIYDVSNGARMYGPGGSYHFFAGCDASRGFVTGCFQEDRTADMRGVVEMFIPLDDAEVDSRYTTAEFEKLKEQERKEAEERVHSSLQHWVDFFGNSKKYSKVGYVKHKEGWPDNTPMRELCAAAQKQRKKRPMREV